MARQGRGLSRHPEAVVGADAARGALLKGPALIAALGLGTAGLLFVRDPHVAGSYGFCPFQALTGLDCPGCGGTRAAYDVLHGDFAAAVSSNALAVCLFVVLAVAYVRWIPKRWRGEQAPMIVLPARVGAAVLIGMAVFTVLRNTPWGAWLAS